jgi:hypothetical protein
LHKFINFLEAKANQAIELFDFASEDNIDKVQNGTGSTEKETQNYSSPQHLDAINFLQSTFYWFYYYVMNCFQPINHEMLRIVPQVYSILKIKILLLILETLISFLVMQF